MNPLVLLSGGLDSAVVLERVRTQNPVALTFNYGQPHIEEIAAAKKLCGDTVRNIVVDVSQIWTGCDEGLFGEDDTNAFSTVVRGRNHIFIAVAVAVALQHGCDTVLIGCNLDDHLAYPDCRPEFIKHVQRACDTGGCDVAIMYPLIRMTKRQVVSEAVRKGIDIESTVSCYRGTNCGECSACISRSEAGI